MRHRLLLPGPSVAERRLKEKSNQFRALRAKLCKNLPSVHLSSTTALFHHPSPHHAIQARFKIDPSHDLPPLLNRQPNFPAGKIIGLRSPVLASDHHAQEGGGIAAAASISVVMAAMTQQFDDTAKIILSNSSLSSQQHQQQNHQHHNHMQLPILSSHTAGHWTPLPPSTPQTIPTMLP